MKEPVTLSREDLWYAVHDPQHFVGTWRYAGSEYYAPYKILSLSNGEIYCAYAHRTQQWHSSLDTVLTTSRAVTEEEIPSLIPRGWIER